ncbi:flap endonuclease GEN-like 1 [Zea mays]|uniref:Flap endonuclease GEN-like 1 n=1 Tax=Zea mays TaxID=4577 RepID=A0A1D6ETB7_MAIZE|nr:flap endonuclease GEN-like 1 [Zea mays]ONM22947.1 Flap endonuclease GEN-like 1 [Zea mays]ONM22952.1 Flap endonuclease GEN-like 1 [Zea mays]|eukprot:XP_008670332.1 flap endonuclease GEN-like 1 [Zea mays]
MGVGGSFWDLLKPCARHEGAGYLRGRRVAVDLSFWVVSHTTAIRARLPRARSPHLRTTFFRTLSLFAKMGAFPVFVVDGEPSPLKSQARAARFFRGSGMDLAALPVTEAESSAAAAPVKKRNAAFTRAVEECVELLEYLGMPVLRANGEAEALCAQLNSEGHVDACITADSDAFLYGAKTVVKVLRSNCKEPFECYHIADIESGLGLKRKQMVAMALLIGSDHDLHGVPGFGLETALRFVQLFDEDEILDKLHEIGRGVYPFVEGFDNAHIDDLPSSSTKSPVVKLPHCSQCGHPGSKKNHSKDGCNYCLVDSLENCMEKPTGFKCECPSCDEARELKEQRRHENWQIKVCKRIAAETNFPNDEIIKLYLSDNNLVEEKGVPLLTWNKPDVEALVDLLSYKQNWEPSYIRQSMLPMLSTIYLREVASSPSTPLLLCDQYEFDSIQRIKIKHGHPYYLVKWKRATRGMNSIMSSNKPVMEGETSSEVVLLDEDDDLDAVVCESPELLDEPDVPQVLIDDGCCFVLTDEDIQLVGAAFPKETARFQEEQRLKEARSRSRKSKSSLADSACKTPEGPRPSGVQLSITEFYRSKKAQNVESGKKPAGEGHAARGGSRKSSDRDLDKSLPKSVRRRLLFDC